MSPETPGFGQAHRFRQVRGWEAAPRLAIGLFQARSFRITLRAQAFAAGVDLALRSTVSVEASEAVAGTAVSDSVPVGGPAGVLDWAGPGLVMGGYIGTILGGAGRDTVITDIRQAICMEAPMLTLMRSRTPKTIQMSSLPKVIQTPVQARPRRIHL